MASLEATKARLEVLEKDAEQHRLERGRWELERVALNQELNDAKESERQARLELQRKIEQLQRQMMDDTHKLSSERDRASRQAEMMINDAQKQLNDAEIANSRLQGTVTKLSKEAASKDDEVRTALKEREAIKEGMESIIRELVDKNKRIEQNFKLQLENAQEEIQHLLDEHKQQAQELVELKKIIAHSHDETTEMEAAADNAKAINRQLLMELEEAKKRADMADDYGKEVERYQRDAADARADLDLAVAKLAKADAHVQEVSDEAAANHVTLIKLRHQVELAEDSAATAKRDREELLHRMSHIIFAISDETDKCVSEVDGTVESLQALVTIPPGGAALEGSSKLPAGLHLPQRRSVTTTKVEGENPGQVEQAALATAMKIRDTLSFAREDFISIQRGLVEEAIQKRNVSQKDNVVDEMLKAERAHVVEVTALAAELDNKFKAEVAKSSELEKSLTETSVWMADAVKVSEERAKRMDAVLEEKLLVQEKLNQAEAGIKDLKEILAGMQSEKISNKGDLDTAKQQIQRQHQGTLALEDEMATLRRNLTSARQDVEAQRVASESLKSELVTNRQRVASLETEIAFLRKQGDDQGSRTKQKDMTIEHLEKTNHDLRDSMFHLQTRLDAALRANSGLGSLSDGGASASGGGGSYSAAVSESARKVLQFHNRGVSPSRSGSVHTAGGGSYSGGGAVGVGGGGISPRPAAAADLAGGASPAPLPAASASSSSAAAPGSSDRVKAWEARINSLLHSGGASS